MTCFAAALPCECIRILEPYAPWNMDSCLTNDSVHARRVVASELLQRASDEKVCLSGHSQWHLPSNTTASP